MTDPLIVSAVKARLQAHAPYSRFLVGAALRCDDGSIHAGCNVENAAYPQGACAETGAISAMVLAGGRRIVDFVIAGGGTMPCSPCGGCRQRIREFAGPDAVIRMVDQHGLPLIQSTLGALLPHSFGPESLGQASTFEGQGAALDPLKAPPRESIT